jgi:hypothetical protein
VLRLPDQKPIISANVVGTAINDRGRPMLPPAIDELLKSETPKQ